MAIDENDPRLKDMLRAIELGDLPEDLPPDPEEYDDMGGIKSLDRGAPSIKMASETPEEELQLELGTVYEEFLDAVKNGFKGSFEDYAKEYFTRKKVNEDRKLAMNGGRMQYGDGNPGAMGNPAVVGPKMTGQEMREFMIMNPDIEDVADYKSYYKKLKAQDEEIKRMLEKAKKEKKKLAKGGIAGVL
jgi:hypothetical protein